MLLLALVLLVRSDLSHLNWVANLSREGSPPPERDSQSPTGYAHGQRFFLATHERGDTYRWISRTQELIASGVLSSSTYQSDNVPEGRTQLTPRLYAGWLGALSWILHFATGESVALSVERAALWEPLISHVLLFAAAVAFMWIRRGPAGAGLAGLFLVLFPPVFGQFLPGVLTARTWAIFLSAYALARPLAGNGDRERDSILSVRSALATGLALWLDPMFGFPVVLILGLATVGAIFTQNEKLPCLRWSLVGAGVTLMGWLIDRSPWDPAVSELRYVHPLYALAWIGIGLGLDAGQNFRTANPSRKWRVREFGAALAPLSPLVYTQLHGRYLGWLYPSTAMRRLTSLDETSVHNTALDWFSAASPAEAFFVSATLLLAIVIVAIPLWRRLAKNDRAPAFRAGNVLLVAGLLVFAYFRIRWGVVAVLVSLPVIGHLVLSTTVARRRGLLAIAGAFLVGLFAWGQALPASFLQPKESDPARPSDLESLLYRHFSYWLASHNPERKVTALAPPELSDSLVFHGGCRVLMSTAWEAYSGQVAASRILSAPEASEAEAVMQSREITHVILPSWDNVLPLLVRNPDLEGKDTLYARLQRWVHPRFLRAVPYRLPSVPGYLGQKLAVFKVTAPQDEALSLSRLAEYFVEMDRAEPAGLAAKVLAESFADDPNAIIARATVQAYLKNRPGFEAELARLAASVNLDQSFLPWDQRVQRAIVLALGHRNELARAEVEASVAAASPDDLLELTPLQAYRLRTLMTGFHLAFPEQHLDSLLNSLGAEYAPAGSAQR